ncbi:MAG: hypothetical protein Q3962_02745 [Corynebacterium sp.]|nr:hypothetical protein [Corynebacterium sp.]
MRAYRRVLRTTRTIITAIITATILAAPHSAQALQLAPGFLADGQKTNHLILTKEEQDALVAKATAYSDALTTCSPTQKIKTTDLPTTIMEQFAELVVATGDLKENNLPILPRPHTLEEYKTAVQNREILNNKFFYDYEKGAGAKWGMSDTEYATIMLFNLDELTEDWVRSGDIVRVYTACEELQQRVLLNTARDYMNLIYTYFFEYWKLVIEDTAEYTKMSVALEHQRQQIMKQWTDAGFEVGYDPNAQVAAYDTTTSPQVSYPKKAFSSSTLVSGSSLSS